MSLRRLAGLAVLGLASACVHFPSYPALVAQDPATRILIRDARVFTATSHALLEHQDVEIEDGLILSIHATEPERKFVGKVIDGAGKTLLPGLVDLHTHTTLSAAPPWYKALPDPRHNLEAHLYAGTTTVLDLGGSIKEIIDERLHIARGEWNGPRVLFAGPLITKRGGYPISMLRSVYGSLAVWLTAEKVATEVDDAEEARLAVRERWAQGASIIKVVVADIPRVAPRLNEEELRAIVDQASQLGLKVAAHIDTAADAALAARVGIKLLAHGVETDALTDEQAKDLAASGVTCEPTLINYLRFDEMAQYRFTVNPIEQQSESPGLIASFAADEVKKQSIPPDFFAWGDELEKHEADRARNAKKMFDAGVPLVIGTDAMGSVGSFAGDIHSELKLLADAGIPAVELLLAVTTRAAHFLQPQPSFGTIEVGKSADLILLNGNPLENIEMTQAIDTVIVRGHALVRTAAPR
jgi:imidazolonepropionase-like amidohydrolase